MEHQPYELGQTPTESLVRDGFWGKAKSAASRMPFVEDAVSAYFCTIDARTPTYVRGVLIGALAYFIVPTDMIPDFVAAFGFADDATVMTTALSAVGGALRDCHRQAAREWLGKTAPEQKTTRNKALSRLLKNSHRRRISGDF